ncbi:hypothetical protein NUACC26_085640 [Scytonema sp. NUACC26]
MLTLLLLIHYNTYIICSVQHIERSHWSSLMSYTNKEKNELYVR